MGFRNSFCRVTSSLLCFNLCAMKRGQLVNQNFQCRILPQKYYSAHEDECARFMSASVHRP